MPSSAWEHNGWASQHYDRLAPQRVLDIGPGSGKWPKVMENRPAMRRDAHWTGLEIFPRYILDYELTRLYDRIIVDDVRNLRLMHDLRFDDDTPAYDLIIMGDVLEHLQPAEAERVMLDLRRSGSALLIAGPIVVFEQGEWGGNVHETHHWHPTVDDWLRLVQPDDYVLGDIIGLFWKDGSP